VRPSPPRQRDRPARPVSGDPAAARVVLDEAAVHRVLSRITHEILEKTGGAENTILLGIPTRGIAIARRIAALSEQFEGIRIPVGQLDVTMYRDDLAFRGPRPLESTHVPADGIDAAPVVLVDDVLFSGRTVRAALDTLGDIGRPAVVQLAVLVDRGHRELPIRADYVGKNIPTSLADTVHVLLTETDGRTAVLLGPADLSHKSPPEAPQADVRGARGAS
jgi:pyrimidine operon attenuation protein/uracil phosphoribosyltransferase